MFTFPFGLFTYSQYHSAARLLETVHSALCIHVLYDYFITHFGNPAEGINKIVWCVISMQS